MLGFYLRKHLGRLDPVLGACARINVRPDAVSIFSLLPAAFAAACIINRRYLEAAMLAGFSLFLDLLDGACARSSGRQSNLGEYIDALCDRYRELIFYCGFALGGFPLEALFALSGSFLISFAKARTAMCASIDDHDWPAAGDLADRSFLLLLGLLIAGFKPVWFSKYELISFDLMLIGLLTHTGCVYRMIYAGKLILKGSK